MKVQDLFEERQSGWSYVEKRVKGALQKVTVALQGNDSGAMTRLTKRYERLDKSAKLLKEKRDQLNAQIKDIGDRVFDAEDALATRIIETIQYTIMLTAAEKAETKSPTKKIDYEAAFHELAKLVPELTKAADEIREKYTELIPAKDTPTALKVKSKVEESLAQIVQSTMTKFVTWIKSWGADYDTKLNAIKKKYPVKGARA